MGPNSNMTGVLIKGGNLDTDRHVARMPGENWRDAATSQGAIRNWRQTCNRICPWKESVLMTLDLRLPGSRTVRQ